MLTNSPMLNLQGQGSLKASLGLPTDFQDSFHLKFLTPQDAVKACDPDGKSQNPTVLKADNSSQLDLPTLGPSHPLNRSMFHDG